MSSEFIARRVYNSDHSSPVGFIWSHVRRHPGVAILMIFGAFSNAALASAVPYLIGVAMNAIIADQNMRMVLWASVLIVISQVARGFLQLIRNYSSATFGERIERDVRDELYASLLGKSMDFHDFQPVGEIMARVTNDVHELNMMMSPGMNLIIGSSMFLLLPLLVAPTIHPYLIVVPLLFVMLYVVIQWRYVRQLHGVAQDVRSSFGHMNARLAETLDGIQVVKGSAQEAQEISLFKTLVDTVRDKFVQQGDVEARYLAAILIGLAQVAGLLHAAFLYRAGLINAGDIVAFMGQLGLFFFPVFSSLYALSRAASGYAGAERILNIILTETNLDENRTGYASEMEGDVVFENVCFSYLEEGKEVVRDISFTVKGGKTVAIVGQTGSGKSTIAKLINRTYDVNEGRVLVDGRDVREWSLEALRSQISIIEQEIFLFSRSVADNIRFGRPDATQEEVETAARKAQAYEFIMGLPDGFETVIGQRGVTLSGGQRQRLAIARAFLTNPHILILDDSTSAIDSATEDHIQKAIWAAAEGRTTILITHRLSQIRWADHIVVLRKGQIVAQGTHEDLLETSDAYRRIFARYEGKTLFQDATAVRKYLKAQSEIESTTE